MELWSLPPKSRWSWEVFVRYIQGSAVWSHPVLSETISLDHLCQGKFSKFTLTVVSWKYCWLLHEIFHLMLLFVLHWSMFYMYLERNAQGYLLSLLLWQSRIYILSQHGLREDSYTSTSILDLLNDCISLALVMNLAPDPILLVWHSAR